MPDSASFTPTNRSKVKRLHERGKYDEATVFAILRKKNASLDQMQKAFGFTDPIDFIHALLGHKPLPNQAAAVVVTELLGRLWNG